MRYGMVIDLDDCVRCRSCYVTCKVANKIPTEFDVPGKPARMWFDEHPEGKYPAVSMVFIPYHCMQCDDTPCVDACPTGASHKNLSGVITVDAKKCKGCKACVEACPYNARYFREDRKVADNCDFCSDRVAEGLAPSCAEKCTGGAILFGDLDDPRSEVSRKIASAGAKPLKSKMAATKPKVYYVGRV